MKQVCIQGLGYVGAAMATAVALARDENGEPRFDVTGVDLPNHVGLERVSAMNAGKFPFVDNNNELSLATHIAVKAGNLRATTDVSAYSDADIVVVDVQLDISSKHNELNADFRTIEQAVKTIGKNIAENTLIVIETTVPPGTCDNIILPILRESYRQRGFDENSIKLSHSYERVMPGENYLDSLINYWRVFSANTDLAATECESFLSAIINVENYPLTRVASLRASEAAKVLENSYRAANIAFIDEWTRYAEDIGFDLYEVIDAIRFRPTHSNIRAPGLGVGGYCLPKDPLFAPVSITSFYKDGSDDFPFSRLAIETNRNMPQHSVDRLKVLFQESLAEKKILVCGVSYRQNVGDTRNSPSEYLVRCLEAERACLDLHDPFVKYWDELSKVVLNKLPDICDYDIVVLAVPHDDYIDIDIVNRATASRNSPFIFDLANVLSTDERSELRKNGVTVESIGRGSGL